MPTPIIVPKATISMEQGVIVRWLKSAGDEVARDEVLFELETDKAILEVPAPGPGTLLRILRAEGQVNVDEIVGWVGHKGEEIRDVAAHPKDPQPAAAETGPPRHSPPVVDRKPFATPAARKRTQELGVNLTDVQGSGPEGRVTVEDVERHAAKDVQVESPSRRSLVKNLTNTWQAVPHIHIGRQTDALHLVLARDAAKRLSGGSITFTDIILWSLARILHDFPSLLSIHGSSEKTTGVHLAFAVDTGFDVVAPVISGSECLTLRDLSVRRQELSEAARARRLKYHEVQGGNFTLTNLGMEGADFFAPIINAPQTAILATGRVARTPVIEGEQIVPGWRMWTNLAVDHRYTDGAVAARFLERLERSFAALAEELKEAR